MINKDLYTEHDLFLSSKFDGSQWIIEGYNDLSDMINTQIIYNL